MNKINTWLKKFSIEDSKTKEIQTTDNTVLNLWPSHNINDLLKIPLFYELPIIQPVLLTQDQFLNSLKRKNVPQEIIKNIVLINVDYKGFDNQIYHGQIEIHKDLASSIKRIFKRVLSETDFPITSVLPISMFKGNSSSKHNNCGAFDWRFVKNSKEISDHSFGTAIDINPILNPWVGKYKLNSPNHPYNPSKRGTLHANSDLVKIFKEEGWKWGGDWKNSKDWMHFYRPEIPFKDYGKIEVIE